MENSRNPFVFFDVSIDGGASGRMVFELYADVVPKIVEKFRPLCTVDAQNINKEGKSMHYKGTHFYRVVKGLSAQVGDFSELDGVHGENIHDCDVNKSKDKNPVLCHDGPGVLSMPNLDGEKNDSRFCITFKAAPHLDRKYIVFGRLIQGHKTLKDIENIGTNDGLPIVPVEIANSGELNGCKILGSVPAGNGEGFENANRPDVQHSDTSKCYKDIKTWESKIYGGPKRRRSSAIRDFPPGCGPHAANMNKLECTEAIASPMDKVSLDERGESVEDNGLSEDMQIKGDAKMEVEHFHKARDSPVDKIFDGDLRQAEDTNRMEEDKDNTDANAVVHSQFCSFDSLRSEKNMSAFREFPLGSGNNALKMNVEGSAKTISSLSDKMSVDELKPSVQRQSLIHSHSSSSDSLKSDRNMSTFQDFPLCCGSDALKVNAEDPTQTFSSMADKMSADELKLVVRKEPFLENTNMVHIVPVPEKRENYVDDNHLQSKKSHVFECGNMVNVRGSILYGPPKRRKVSALRDFPLGCSASTTQLGMEGNTKDSVSNANNLGYVKPSVDEKAKGHGKAVVNEKVEQAKEERIESRQTHKRVEEASCKHQEDSVSRHNVVNIKKTQSQASCKHHGPKSPDKVASWISNQKDEEISRENSVNSISKDSIREGSVEEEQEDNILPKGGVKSWLGRSDRKKSTKMSQMAGYHGRKASFLDAKSQLKASAIDDEGRNSNRITVDVKHENRVNNNKRKHSIGLEEDVSSSSRSVSQRMSENHGAVVPHGNVFIVQALMAAPNCPWRNGKQSINTCNSPLSMEKVNDVMKTKKRCSSKKSQPLKLSKSREIILLEDQNENLFTDEGHRLSPSPAQRELSVTVMPLGLHDSSSMDNCINGYNKSSPPRNQVRKVLRLFQVICRKLLQEEESKSREPGRSFRIDLKAATILKEKNEWVNTGKPILGIVPGVEIGDEFHFRTELAVVGLHRPYQGGIDMTKIGNLLLATSIVAGGNSDDLDSSDVLIYSGAGGLPGNGDKPPEDQKLERGNLALKNSIEANQPVRVIRGCKEPKNDTRDGKSKFFSTFTYDGLYMVDRYWKEKVHQGYFAFKFQLTRVPDQPELALKEVKKSKKLSARPGTCVRDISDGKERIPICAVNTIDNELPPKFKYITKIMYPTACSQKSPRGGCNCKNGCSDSEKCECAVKNGGEIPFNYNGAIVQAKPLVYECGSSCKCPPSCHNRVSQYGIKIQLEIFKTESMGWGVRSLNSIPSGSFICEYIGELLPDSIAEHRDNDEYLFDIGHNFDDNSLWEGLPSIIPDGHTSNAPCEVVDDAGGGFTIDAAQYGNVGRFFNHSCSPNLYAQNLLYDHDDKKMPHIMFFAAENIPPLHELTYHYNYTIDKVCDDQGNIKRKDCHCGSLECSGRLY